MVLFAINRILWYLNQILRKNKVWVEKHSLRYLESQILLQKCTRFIYILKGVTNDVFLFSCITWIRRVIPLLPDSGLVQSSSSIRSVFSEYSPAPTKYFFVLKCGHVTVAQKHNDSQAQTHTNSNRGRFFIHASIRNLF